MKRPALGVSLAAFLAGLVLASPGFADIVYLKSGGRIEGKASRSGPEVIVETLAGTTRVRDSAVESIDFEHEARIETYLALRADAEEAGTPAKYLELAAWALEAKAPSRADENVADARLALAGVEDAAAVLALALRFEDALGARLAPVWERTLELDPESERARRALGYRRVGEGWRTEEEFQVAQGKVEFEGAWMTPAERDLIQRARKTDFDRREKDLLKAERELADREAALDRDFEKVERVKAELEARNREMNRQLREMVDREEELRRRERFLNSLFICRSCNARYTGIHLCPNEWIPCPQCGGRFPPGHRCR